MNNRPNMEAQDNQRSFFLPKETLDTTNSITWFIADGFWMLQLPKIGYVFMALTVISGIVLLFIDKRRPVVFINIAILFWIFMNTFWMLSDGTGNENYLFYSQVCFGLGICFIALAASVSDNLKETFSHFKRFRFTKK